MTTLKDLEDFDRRMKAEREKEVFVKRDDDKAPMAILADTGSALSGVARVMAHGANKYSRENWRNVNDKERYVSAALRHIFAYAQGERRDSESGLDHLDHAICSLLFLSEIDKTE